MHKISIFWHRRDLRIEDNAGLYKALTTRDNVVPLFIYDDDILSRLEQDDVRIPFIQGRIEALADAYRDLGVSMLIRKGSPVEVWRELLMDFEIEAVYTNRDYEPNAIARDKAVFELLDKHDIPFQGSKDHVIFEKNEVVKADGSPYLVFTPYSKSWLTKLNDFYLKSYPVEKYYSNFSTVLIQNQRYSLGELGFTKAEALAIPSDDFPTEIISTYDTTRDFPAQKGTTKLSVHLRFGTISIRKLARTAQGLNDVYLKELIWRDFYQMILFHFPDCPDKAIRPEYDKIEWEHNDAHFEAWCQGKTGYPMVDAGMRELNATGYMHNRVRMVVASFLTKHLLIDWRLGERYFAEKLLDYDLAANVGGWQWAAGSGCDAAPYFRIFNPESQMQKFDPELKYIKRWVPEYGTSKYPKPIVDHKEARNRALSRYAKALKGSA